MIFRKNRTVLTVFAGWMMVVLPSSVTPAFAGCDLQVLIEKYQDPEGTEKSRKEALAKLARPCKGYIAVTSDELLLDVLNDALRRSYDRAVIQTVFSRYRCIPGVAEEEGYSGLAQSLDTVDCPSGYDRQNWFVVAVSGALLRSRPAKSSRRVGWVKRGVVVEKLDKSGDWLKVKTWNNKTGFIREDLLAFY
jgi:hypothetical protein